VRLEKDIDLAMIGKEHVITLMNHKYDIDWLMAWILAERLQMLGVTTTTTTTTAAAAAAAAAVHGRNTVQPASADTPNFLEQNFTACTPFLTATSAFSMGKSLTLRHLCAPR